jgi:hypothetical protein
MIYLYYYYMEIPRAIQQAYSVPAADAGPLPGQSHIKSSNDRSMKYTSPDLGGVVDISVADPIEAGGLLVEASFMMELRVLLLFRKIDLGFVFGFASGPRRMACLR